MRLLDLFNPPKQPVLSEMAIGLGASYTVLSDDQVRDYLRGIIERSASPANQREKRAALKAPLIHRNLIRMDANGDIDLRALKIAITTPPAQLLRQAEKMKETSNNYVQVYSLTIPALEALIVNQPDPYSSNINDWQFAKVNSCPGAGECQLKCYARKGSFVQFENVSMAGMRMLNFLLNHPDAFFAKLEREIQARAGDYAESPITAGQYQNPIEIKTIIRWHVAGDFFSPEYVERSFDLARRHPTVVFYAYTKMANVVNHPNRPPNFHIRMSDGANPQQTKKVDMIAKNISVVVPMKLYKPFMEVVYNNETNRMSQLKVDGVWQYRDVNGLKNAIATAYGRYGVARENILTLDEFHVRIAQGDPGSFAVIIRTGEADVYQEQARILFLLEH